MADELYCSHEVFRRTVDHCLNIASRYMRESLKDKWFGDDSEGVLQNSQYAQPATFIAEYALSCCLTELDIEPASLLGYSFGELVAATIAGIFDLEVALNFVIARGKLMQSLPVGAMLSIPFPADEVKNLCPPGISIAIDNKDSCVVSGNDSEIKEFALLLKKKRIITAAINSNHAAHSPAMKLIDSALQDLLSTFKLNPPRIPLISSVTGLPLTNKQAISPEYWASQAIRTVCFVKGLEYLLAQHKPCVFVEVGVGRDLINLARRYVSRDDARKLIQLIPEESKVKELPYLFWKAIGKLWQLGVQLNWGKIRGSIDRRRVSLPGYAFDRTEYWSEHTNFIDIFINTPNKQGISQSVIRHSKMSDWLYQHAWKQQPLNTLHTPVSQEKTLLLRLSYSPAKEPCLENSLHDYYQRFMKIHLSKESIINLNGWSQCIAENKDGFINYFKAISDETQSISNVIIDYVDSELCVEELLIATLSFLKAYRSNANNNKIRSITFLVRQGVLVCNETKISPSAAALMSIPTVIRQEFPELSCRTIDIGLNAKDCSMTKLLAEFSCADTESVAYRSNRRWTRDFVPYIPLMQHNIEKLKTGGTYLLVGGAGFIGKTFSEHLAAEYTANIVITSRSQVQLDSAWQSIESKASSLCFYQADASDLNTMRSLVKETVAEFGNIDGVFYLAGVTGEASLKSIIETDSTYIKTHLQAKQHGIIVLEQILSDIVYDFCIIVSSLAPILGGLGFYAYAAASSYLDAFVLKHNQQNDSLWTLINWDGWELAEKSEVSEKVGSSLSHLLISKQEGILLLPDVLGYQEKDALVISTASITDRITQWSNPINTQEMQDGQQDFVGRPDLDNQFREAKSELAACLVAVWEEFLRIKPIGVTDDFFDLGGNSLKAITLLSQIHKSLGIDVPLTHFFKYPTIEDIAKKFGDSPSNSDYVAIKAVQEEDSYPLSPGQRRIYMQQML